MELRMYQDYRLVTAFNRVFKLAAAPTAETLVKDDDEAFKFAMRQVSPKITRDDLLRLSEVYSTAKMWGHYVFRPWSREMESGNLTKATRLVKLILRTLREKCGKLTKQEQQTIASIRADITEAEGMTGDALLLMMAKSKKRKDDTDEKRRRSYKRQRTGGHVQIVDADFSGTDEDDDTDDNGDE